MGSGSLEFNNLNMGEASGFKLVNLFDFVGPGPPPRPPPQDLNYLNCLLFKLFNSRPELNNLNMGEASGFKLFKLLNSRPQLNNSNNSNNINPGGGSRGGVREPGN